MYQIFFCIILFLGHFVFGQTPREYINKYIDVAIEKTETYGVPTSIILAQGILESASGTSKLSIESNNHFGIKCHNWTGEKIYPDYDKEKACYRRYNSALESYNDHSFFLKNTRRYRDLFNLEISDYKSWAYGLKEKGYATDPDYADKLIAIIEKYQLYIYDNSLKQEQSQITNIHPNRILYDIVDSNKGLEEICKKYNLTIETLLFYNDLPMGNSVKIGDTIFLQEKRPYGYTSQHITTKGENLREISQKYGIKLINLYKRNGIKLNKISALESIKAGMVLVMRSYK